MKKLLMTLLFFINTFCYSQDGWFWQNPLPTGNNLNALFFLNTSVGWCVGDVGTIIKTSDGGFHWETQEAYTDFDLNEIYFVDDLTGWIAGNGVVLSTTDGGEVWNNHSPNIAVNYNSICFINKQNGWCCGDSLIYSSMDGGQTWNGTLIHSSSNLKSITFLNSLNGWAVGSNSILKTTDGGETWDVNFLPIHFLNSDYQKIEFANQNAGWIIESRFERLCCNSSSLSGTIWKTEDGGSTWNIVFFDSTSFSFYYPQHYFTDLTFTDELNGLFNSINGIYLTNDGGKNWNYVSDNNSSSYFMISENVVYAAGLKGILYKSLDYAKTWLNLSNSTRVNLNKIQFLDSLIGIAAGYNNYTTGSSILKTSDGGRNWFPSDYFYSKKVGITDLSFINSLTGWASARELYQGTYYTYNSGLIFSTTDGGNNWTQLIDDSSYHSLFAIKFRDTKNGIAAGSGEILTTNDAGKNWNSAYYSLYGIPEFNSVAFQDTESIWVGGFDQLFFTDNYGLSWEKYSVLANMQYYIIKDILFVNSSIGWIAGTNSPDRIGFILKTSDGGKIWQNVLVSSPTSFNSLFFFDENTGIAVGDSGTIAMTSDRGSSWNVQKIHNVRNNLLSISSTDPMHIWISGENGVIINGAIPSLTNINNDEGLAIPQSFFLYQNFPNPFNPSTTIRYQIPENGLVTLKVYDVLGREVATLVNEEKPAGSYEIEFDGNQLSSGVYFYRLNSDSFISIKKMLIIK